ncbi:hypothetical protein EVAR_14290_1 [Eumeta japonica]|uniref:Uncharacterized protein n=1 Tax=Eumeta variegata TaxID=151549 RepID=A0A4C1UMC4_EUMVA|nr:hypothetical protein EVAR_14290_1 [Eumeta japonica]
MRDRSAGAARAARAGEPSKQLPLEERQAPDRKLVNVTRETRFDALCGFSKRKKRGDERKADFRCLRSSSFNTRPFVQVAGTS